MDTIEAWAREYISTTSLDHKRSPPPPPRAFASGSGLQAPSAPGRPTELRVTRKAMKSPGPEALRAPERRAGLLHTFFHHELQAAELMCWAILAFPSTPEAFRQGLLGVARDEIRHMAMYAAELEALGFGVGDFPVRDWFWERVPAVTSPLGFVATFGMGLEGANLDHTARFAERFRAVGDERGAALQERVGAEEIPHVRFALKWFARWTGQDGGPPHAPDDVTFQRWSRALPPPLSPQLMRGNPLNREARLEAGFAPEMIDELARWSPDEDAPCAAPGS